MVLQDGKTFAAKARELGPEILNFWDGLWRDEKAPLPMRLRASELIVERGFGKAANTLDINVNDSRAVTSLSIEEMERILAGEQPRFNLIDHDGEIVDAEFTTVTTTAEQT